MKNIECKDVKIYQTLDYERFNKIPGNRTVNPNKIKKIINVIQIDKINILKYAPIIVDRDYSIIDGQHRFHVSKKLKREVYYVIATKTTIRDIARINSNTANWTQRDYLKCYTKLKMEPYLILESFLEKYEFMPLGTAGLLLDLGTVNTGGSGQWTQRFRDGRLEINHFQVAEAIANHAERLKPFCEMVNRPLLRALSKLSRSKLYTQETMLSKLK